MKLKDIDIGQTLIQAKALVDSNSIMDSGVKALMSLLIMIIELLAGKFGTNSRNSHTPPSQDPFRNKKKSEGTRRKPGGQLGHKGSHLSQTKSPDEIVKVLIDHKVLPEGGSFIELPPEKRQVVDIRLSVFITEYQAQILKDNQGNIYKADFPEAVKAPIQYGPSVRSFVCYMSNYQLVPNERLTEIFWDQFELPLSAGTVVNINQDGAQALQRFKKMALKKLQESPYLNLDETGVNVGGKGAWLHSASSSLWAYFEVSPKRGNEAMDAIGILPNFRGVMIHDNWKPYFKYADCQHALCNAHQIRELTRITETEQGTWAQKMIAFLCEAKDEKEKVQGPFSDKRIKEFMETYDQILALGIEECFPDKSVLENPRKRGREKKTKSQTLLLRLQEKKKETLLFLTNEYASFTNNMAERDIRMLKVHQKISGCYKTFETANDACLIRSFISTCRKQGICISEALNDLFKGKLPTFSSTSTTLSAPS